MEDINFDAGVSVTNIIQEDENKRKTSTTSIYLKPTTMRGIPLASLIPSPIRGFYITRNENDPLSSTDSSTSPYTTVEQQAETTLISDISTTDETVTHNDRIESGPNALDNVNDIVKDVDGREEKYSSSVSKDSGNAENFSNHEKPDLITIPIDRPASKREKSLHSFDHTTPLSNSVVSPTTPTRRRIALAVNKYIEATTPLWTGRRVVAKKRNRTTISPIKDAIRRTESDSIRTVTSALRNASLTTAKSTLTSRRRKRPTTSTILSIAPDSTASPEVLNIHNDLANSNDTKTEDPESHATVEAAVTLTNSVTTADISTFSDDSATMTVSAVADTTITTTPSTIAVAKAPAATTDAATITTTFAITNIGVETTSPNYSVTDNPTIEDTKIIPTNDPTIADTSPFSDDLTTMMVSTDADTTITTTPLTIAIAKAPAATTNVATITTTSAITNIGVETTSPNYSVTDNPTVENTNVILTDSTAAIAFAASTEPEITKSTNLNIVPETAQTIVTDPVTKSTVASTEIEATSTMTNYSTTTIPDTVNAQEITIIDFANNTTTTEMIIAGIGATSTIATTINTHDVMTDATLTTTQVETTSMIGNYSTFTTTAIKNTTTIPVTTLPVIATTSPLTTVISSTVNMQHVQATAPMTANNLADANTIIANMTPTTTPLSIINPTITDFNVIMTSANANIPSTSAISETSPTIQSKTSFSSKTPITSTIITSTSAAPTILTTESSTIHLANPNNLDINSNFETVTATAASTQITEIPTTFETPSIFTSIANTFTKPLHSTNFETSSVVTAALSTQEDKSFFTPKVTQTPSTVLSVVSITNKVFTALERSTTSATHSSIVESITTNPAIRTTNAASARTISEKSTIPERKTSFKEVTSTESRTEDQITTTINKPSSARTMSEKSTTPEMKITEESEKVTSKIMENQKQNQTTSEFDSTNYQFNQKTARRRVLNRTNNWLGSPVTLQRTNQHPRHSVTSYRGRSRTPTYISSSKMIEKNSRRRIVQKRLRVNSEAFNSTVGSDWDTADVQNTTKDHVMYDRVENVNKMKVILKNVKEEEMTTILPKEETTVFLQSSSTIKNETFQVHRNNGNIEEKRNILKKVKQSQENFTTKETSTNSSSTNENLPNNSQSNLHVTKDFSELEKSRKIMEVVLKDVSPQSEEKNPVKEVNADSDSINTNLQENFSKSPYTYKNLNDKRITGRRRVVLKSIRPKSEEKNSTVEEINMESDSIDKNLQNNLLNNISQNFSNEEKTRRRMRVVLKRVKSKSEKEGPKTEKTNTEYDSTNESLQGTFSNNFYSAKNFPVDRETRRRIRVVLKSVKPKSEEKNSTVVETTVDPDSTKENFQGTFSNNFRSKNIPVEHGTRRKMRVVLKSVKLKSGTGNSTLEETDSDSTNKKFQSTFLNNSHRGKDFPVENGIKRRIRVILKSVKSKSEERNSTTEEMNEDSDSIDKDLQGSFSSNRHISENLSNDEKARKKTEVVLKSVKSISKERDSVAEETSADYDFARKDPQVLYPFHFSSNLHMDDKLSGKEKKHSKFEEKEAMTERPEDTEPQTTRTSIPVEEDTNRPSPEVTNDGSVSRNVGYSNRHRKPTSFTTIAPPTNTLSNTLTVHRRGRPVETTLSPRIDFDAFEDTESYVKPAAVLHDQNTDVSDQSIRAQEFAVTLSEPPSSSSDIGRTALRDVDRRKISTTITPRTDPTISRTVSRYDTNFRSRQKPRTKDRPTVNATTRPRRPPVIDYDYYEDEVPIIVDKSVFNSKLFLTSKGTIRCLDQGNFPHPYSCKKFITCARMVNGQVIGTEYTCPDKLSFDPIGGICNWSAGLGCKD